MRIDRMLAMTVLLLGRSRITAREMAERFEVSVRTIYRDIEAMSVAGIPIVAYPGGGGGYGLIEEYTIDRQLMSFDGMLSILAALRGIHDTLDDNALGTAIEKLEALVPRDRKTEVEQRLKQFVVDLSPWGMPASHKERLRTAQRALVQARVLSFEYQGAAAEPTRRSVEPATLVFKGHSWYLYAYCRLREDFRLFRISRMRAVRIEAEQFVRRPESYEESEVDMTARPSTRFVLRFAPVVRSLVEDAFDPADLDLQADGSLIATFDVPEDEWVYAMILSYGECVEVIEPSHARGSMARRARKILDLYGPDTGVSQA